MNYLVIMGVAGCGKSSFAAALGQKLGLPVIEGDHFHSASSREKMRSGQSLTDLDRAAWLLTLSEQWDLYPDGAILACSALRANYRDVLRAQCPSLFFIHLTIGLEDAQTRVMQRAEHFFNPSLIQSQFATLESPASEARVLTLNAMTTLAQLTDLAQRWLAQQPISLNEPQVGTKIS